MPNYWVVRAGDDIQGEVESRSLIGIGWQDVGHFGALSLEQLKQRIFEAYPHRSPNKRGSIVGQLHRFRGIDVGDIILTPIKSTRQILIGRVTGPYRHDSQPERDRLANTRNVEWIRTDVFRDDVTLPLRSSLGGEMTVFSVNRHADEIAQLAGELPIQRADATEEEDTAVESGNTDIERARAIEEDARERIADLILGRQFDGHEFEWLIAALLKAMGFKIIREPQPGADGGVDIIAAPDVFGFEQPRIIVQVKHQAGRVGLDVVQRLNGTLGPGEKGLLVSTGGFAAGTERQAGPNIALLDGQKVVDYFIEYYESIPSEYKAKVPLKRVYLPVPPDEIAG